jgi:hypothetical protein
MTATGVCLARRRMTHHTLLGLCTVRARSDERSNNRRSCRRSGGRNRRWGRGRRDRCRWCRGWCRRRGSRCWGSGRGWSDRRCRLFRRLRCRQGDRNGRVWINYRGGGGAFTDDCPACPAVRARAAVIRHHPDAQASRNKLLRGRLPKHAAVVRECGLLRCVFGIRRVSRPDNSCARKKGYGRDNS